MFSKRDKVVLRDIAKKKSRMGELTFRHRGKTILMASKGLNGLVAFSGSLRP